jgi:hypothetical protein
MSKERLRQFNERYRELTPSAQSRETYSLTELAAILNVNEKSAFILASLAGAESDGEYDLGLCIAKFEQLRIRALINEDSHPDDQIPMNYGHAVDLREVEQLAAGRFGNENAKD